MSVDTLLVLGCGLNRNTYDRLKRRQDPDLEEAAWTETQKELDAGWSWIANDTQREGLFVALRFALRQGPAKVRLIDDCTINGLNGTAGLRERFELHTVDKLAAMLVTAQGQASPDGLKGWVGRIYHLKAAYPASAAKLRGLTAKHWRAIAQSPGHLTGETTDALQKRIGVEDPLCMLAILAESLLARLDEASQWEYNTVLRDSNTWTQARWALANITKQRDLDQRSHVRLVQVPDAEGLVLFQRNCTSHTYGP